MSKVGEIERKQYQNSDSINFSFDNCSLVIRNGQSVIDKNRLLLSSGKDKLLKQSDLSFSVKFCHCILFLLFFGQRPASSVSILIGLKRCKLSLKVFI